ncbi:farnesyl-diphosphatefarnesyltransferase [Monoraphidium neglectum]|uniref:Squalene synthase n=1 Tax=Monoraphidium neglectum TaxID=145388 RepID=A0A0D2NGI3_9CHLO|nr:farnesyl-diphosphatefarnesyltransferase [Monoraphidium neglectum]KIZ04121.1 farnesyl-diphosphatefarnesyltransferase [Monoraphidium neglectum]|eukprot:XP_013903140.1 farnesyl-diphosphatefarnesyltransferase [Monoraphidium neglectum]
MGKLGELLAHPEEIIPLAKMFYASKQACKLPLDPKLAFCYDILNTVSRSFAVVIQQLPNPLRDAICVFYLVLRGLDTVEDDMAIPNDKKIPDLLKFHEYIYQPGFNMQCGYGHYVRLMREFGTVVDVFLSLDARFQSVIADITRRMGAGMAEFVEREDCETREQYDLYCHYVAGLVGIGLSQLFASSGLESDYFAKNEDLSNHMGLFLQKTNIIRDYLVGRGDGETEDITEEPAPRMFWPREVWGRYASSLDEFKDPANRTAAIHCLNDLVTDALRHVPHCVAFLQQLRDPDVFRFCAIPQIMAAGTLSLCYNNGGVFEGAVKLRRGETARVFDELRTMADVHAWFGRYLRLLRRKALSVASHDPTAKEARAAVDSCLKIVDEGSAEVGDAATLTTSERLGGMLALMLAGAFFYRAWGMGVGSAGALGAAAARRAVPPLAAPKFQRPHPLANPAGAALLGSGPLLPLTDAGLERYLSLVMLAACVVRVIAVRA